MTESRLDQIEQALRVTLPVSYREVSVNFPFRSIGVGSIYWLYDDPAAVIGDTRFPLQDGEYDQANWRKTFVVIGQSAAGDLYFIDTAQASSPVYCLSHEDHTIVEDFVDIEAFVVYWQTEQSEALQAEDRRIEQCRRQRQFTWRACGILGVGVLVGILCIVLLILSPHAHRIHSGIK